MKKKSILQSKMSLEATTASAIYFEVDGIYYNKNGDSTVSVTFKGSWYDAYVNRYTGDVVIPSSVTYSGTTYSVTSIGNDAFRGCSRLTSVTIPNSITSIGERAFFNCGGLTSVSIPNSVTSIGDSAFSGCSRLKSVSIPNSVTSIGDFAFNCSGLKSVTIGNSVTSIGDFAFYGCSGLTRVSIPNSVTSIGNYAFEGCIGLTRVDISSLEAWSGIKFENHYSNPLYFARHLYLNGEEVKDLVIPNSVTSIGDSAFYKCSGLTSVSIPNSVTSIGESAFEGCSGLTSVKIPNSVTSIGSLAFAGCRRLTSVSIPNSVTSIGKSVFEDCSGLESIVVESGNSKYDSRDNCNAIIETATNTLLAGCKNTTIPNSVTSIGNYAFRGCKGLTSVKIPNSVTEIGNEAFYGCSGLKSITIPNSVTSIGEFAFSGCSGLTSVTIPNSVTEIGSYAFSGCSGLTSVTIPNSVTEIGSYAFSDCSGLTTIFYNAENCANFSYNKEVFNYGTNIIIGKDVKKVPNYLFYFLEYAPERVISQSTNPPTCGKNTFKSSAYTAKLYVPSGAITDYKAAKVWKKFTKIEGIETNDAENVAD